MSDRKILFVLTGHDRLGPAEDATADKTGFHLAEAAKPWAVLTDAGRRPGADRPEQPEDGRSG